MRWSKAWQSSSLPMRPRLRFHGKLPVSFCFQFNFILRDFKSLKRFVRRNSFAALLVQLIEIQEVWHFQYSRLIMVLLNVKQTATRCCINSADLQTSVSIFVKCLKVRKGTFTMDREKVFVNRNDFFLWQEVTKNYTLSWIFIKLLSQVCRTERQMTENIMDQRILKQSTRKTLSMSL